MLMKTEILKIILKTIVYICTLILALLGVNSLASCSTSRDVEALGKCIIVTNDTTVINHGRTFNYHYSYKK